MLELINGNEEALVSGSIYFPISTAFVVVESVKGYMLLYNKYRNVWELTGGMIEEGETPKDCAVRECAEESNQIISELRFTGLVKLMMKKNAYRNHDSIEYAAIYHAFIDHIAPFIENDEIRDLRWWMEGDDTADMCDASMEIIQSVNPALECVVEKEPTGDTVDQVVSIAREYTRDYFTVNFPEDMRLDMQFQRVVFLRKDGEIISCIVFTCLDGSPHITLMATKRTYAKRGYGKRLMRHFVEYVSGLGFHSIELFTFSPKTRPVNASTVAFYESVGFQIEREHANLWEMGTKTLKMRKSW